MASLPSGRLAFSIYDSFGQLIRENNEALDKTFIYCYDNIGNITGVKIYPYTNAETPSGSFTQKELSYTDSSNPDRLTKFGYNDISYNSLGCPVSYGDKNFDWTKGKLTRLYDTFDENSSNSADDVRFTYDAYGNRTSKVFDYFPGSDYSDDYLVRSTINYDHDHTGRLIREFCTEEYYASDSITREFIYLYDESGIIGTMYSLNGAELQPYYYRRNAQGDVTAIYDADGDCKAEYAYDAFGNCEIKSSELADLANNNPIRYRGYYYDKETNLYYLNSRYYNPEWCRFISPDSTEYLDPETPNGLNLYCYCGNDPVNYVDPSGHAWEWSIFWNGIGMLLTAASAIALSVTTLGAGIPLAMSIVAGVTLSAGVLTGINGIATMIEAGTNYNFVRDGLFNDVFGLNDSAYNTYSKITGGVAMVGSMVLGFYHTTGQYKAARYGQKYLGAGYKKAGYTNVGTPRYVSKDGLRQMRFDGPHLYKGKMLGKHLNLEKFKGTKPISYEHVLYDLFNYWTMR